MSTFKILLYSCQDVIPGLGSRQSYRCLLSSSRLSTPFLVDQRQDANRGREKSVPLAYKIKISESVFLYVYQQIF